MTTENIFDIWARRNPKFEIKFEESLIRKFTDYGIGASELTSAKGKTFGGGYELYIYAFFIGLYKNKQFVLGANTKTFGHPIQHWGNLASKRDRKSYPKIREYIFAALIARTNKLDLIALEKDEVTPNKAVDYLIETMEEYANYGFHYIEDKVTDNPSFFYKTTSFLDLILDVSKTLKTEDKQLIESLD